VAGEIAALAKGGLRRDELERAKENLKGRIMLSMELTSNRMSRLGKSLVTDSELLSLDQILAEIEAVDADSVAQLADVLLPAEKLSVAGIGPSQERFLDAVERITPALVSAAAA
jgi:predicted Zn-dependent peptidase